MTPSSSESALESRNRKMFPPTNTKQSGSTILTFSSHLPCKKKHWIWALQALHCIVLRALHKLKLKELTHGLLVPCSSQFLIPNHPLFQSHSNVFLQYSVSNVILKWDSVRTHGNPPSPCEHLPYSSARKAHTAQSSGPEAGRQRE
jgi:hypothetical protein